jgi:hypothetical protein
VSDDKILALVKFCGENDIQVAFYMGGDQRVIGVPKYEGFNIDIGEMISVDGHGIAMHDFKSLHVVNPNHHSNRPRAAA